LLIGVLVAVLPQEVSNVNRLRSQATDHSLNRKMDKTRTTTKLSLVGIEVEKLTE
jgi:hypothetical protein